MKTIFGLLRRLRECRSGNSAMLVAMGMPLLDNLDLEGVAMEAARLDRHTFLFLAENFCSGVPVTSSRSSTIWNASPS